MLEIFIKPFIEIIELLLKSKDPKSRARRSARAAVRLHWLLSWVETHSEDFIDGLSILIDEQRLSSRLTGGLEGLRRKVSELKEMVGQDNFGFHTGFWEVAGVFDSSLQREFHALIGVKLHRLSMWQGFLDALLRDSFSERKCEHLFIATDSFAGLPMMDLREARALFRSSPSLEALVAEMCKTGQPTKINPSDLAALQREFRMAQATLKHIAALRERLAAFIKTHYSFDDLL